MSSSSTPAAPGPDGPAPPDDPAPIALPIRGRPAPLAVLLIATTLTVMSAAVLSPVLELIRRDLGLDATRAGLLFSVHGAAVAVTSPLWGRLVDRYGVRRPLAAGMVIYGLGGGSGVFLDSFAALVAGRLVFGIGAAAIFTAATVALLTYYRGPDQDRVMGWRVAAISAGGVVWPMLAGAVGALSWHAPFALYLVGIPLGMAVLRVLPREPERTAATARAGSGGRTGSLLRRPGLAGWLALHTVNGMLLYTAVAFLPLRLAEAGVEAPVLVAVISVTVSLAGSVAGLRYAAVKRRLGYRGLLRIAVTFWFTTFALLALAPNAALIVVAMLLYGSGLGLSMPALTTLIAGSVPPEQRGRATALSGTLLFSGQFLTPLLVGPVMDRYGLGTGYAWAAAIAAVVVAAVFLAPVPDGREGAAAAGAAESGASRAAEGGAAADAVGAPTGGPSAAGSPAAEGASGAGGSARRDAGGASAP